MTTSDEELKELQKTNADKRKLLEDKQRKAAELQRLIQNDQTKGALAKESENLDVQLARADEQLKALEDASGVSADSIQLQTLRSGVAAQEVPPVQVVAPAPDVVLNEAASDATTSTGSAAKRGSK